MISPLPSTSPRLAIPLFILFLYNDFENQLKQYPTVHIKCILVVLRNVYDFLIVFYNEFIVMTHIHITVKTSEPNLMHMVSNLHGPRAVDDLRRRLDMSYYVLAVYEFEDDKY